MLPNPQPFKVFVVLFLGSVYVLFRFGDLAMECACFNKWNLDFKGLRVFRSKSVYHDVYSCKVGLIYVFRFSFSSPCFHVWRLVTLFLR